jgi:hypothetical protein
MIQERREIRLRASKGTVFGQQARGEIRACWRGEMAIPQALRECYRTWFDRAIPAHLRL